MKGSNEKLFQAREFAELTGVTVRTLHHYDRLGLLKPSRYTGAGYRLYGEGDLVRLEQIVALKFIGFSLKEIKDLLKRDSIDMSVALRRQRSGVSDSHRSRRHRISHAPRGQERADCLHRPAPVSAGGLRWRAAFRPRWQHRRRGDTRSDRTRPFLVGHRSVAPMPVVRLLIVSQ